MRIIGCLILVFAYFMIRLRAEDVPDVPKQLAEAQAEIKQLQEYIAYMQKDRQLEAIGTEAKIRACLGNPPQIAPAKPAPKVPAK